MAANSPIQRLQPIFARDNLTLLGSDDLDESKVKLSTQVAIGTNTRTHTHLSNLCKLLKYYSSERKFSPLNSGTLKCITTICSFVSQYPSMEAAMKVSSNAFVKRLFAIGEIAAWGFVYTFVSVGIIDNFLINRELSLQDKNTSCFHGKVYWICLSIISLCLQISDMYISYFYTNSLFWPIFVGGVYASFTLSSLNKAIQKTLKTNNVLTRYWYGTDVCRVFDEREEFCNLLEEHSIAALQSDASQLAFFSKRLNGRSSRSELAEDLISFREIGKERRYQVVSTKTPYVKKIVELISLLLLLSNYILDVNLVYKSSHFISKSIFFSVFLIFVSTVPDIYLDLQMSSSAISDCVWSTASHVGNLVKGHWDSYFNKKSMIRGTGHLFTLAISTLGLGSTITIIRDNIGFEKYWFLAYGILAFTFFFAADAVSSLSSKVVNRLVGYFENEQEKSLALVREKIGLLASRVQQMSADQFRNFTLEIESNTQSVCRSENENA